MPSPLIVSGVLLLAFSVLASGYSIADTVIGNDFYNFFDWYAMPDPTRGRVWVTKLLLFSTCSVTFHLFRNYVDQDTSVDLGLTSASYDSFILRADSTTVLDPSGPGRNSVRIQSRSTYSNHVVVYVPQHIMYLSHKVFYSCVYRFDIRHMPEGCGWDSMMPTIDAGWRRFIVPGLPSGKSDKTGPMMWVWSSFQHSPSLSFSCGYEGRDWHCRRRE